MNKDNEELLSDCCGAPAEGFEDIGICLYCKDHCEFIAEEEEEETKPTNKN